MSRDWPREYWREPRQTLPRGDDAYETALKLLLSEDEEYSANQVRERERCRDLAAVHAQLAVAHELQHIRRLLSARVIVPTPLEFGTGQEDSPQSRTDEQ